MAKDRVKPLRVVTISHSYVVRLNRRLASELRRSPRHNVDVTIVAPKTFPGDLREIDFEPSHDANEKVVTTRVRNARIVHLMTYGRELKETLETRPDIVHCWEEPYVLAAAQVAKRSPLQSKLVYASFQNIDKRYPPPFSYFENYSLSHAKGWIAFGETIHSTLERKRIYSSKPSATIPLGVDTEVFRPDVDRRSSALNELGWRDDIPVVGYLGRFTVAKGLQILMAALDKSSVEWKALFVGGGPLDHQIRNWARRHDDRVRIVTNARHDDVPPLLNAVDVLCAPSLTTPSWREQLGRMILEAFATGVPVIASNSGEIPYVCGDAAMIVPEGNVEELSGAICRLLESPRLRADLSRAGLQRAHDKFAWRHIAARHLEFFDSL